MEGYISKIIVYKNIKVRVPLSIICIYFKTIESGVEDYISETEYILAYKEINYKVYDK